MGKKVRAIFRGLIEGDANRDPRIGDEIRSEIAGKDPDEEEIPNDTLDELLDFYSCHDLLPFAQRILWLNSVKESLGSIPERFHLAYEEIQGLVLYQQELSHFKALEAWRLKQEAESIPKTMPSVPRVRPR